MPVIKTISSPHRFKERFLFFGDGGSGKSRAVLTMARYMPDSHFYINDTDISAAYDRLLALEFQDVEERANITIRRSGDWAEFTEVMDEFDRHNTPENVLVVDNGTFPWPWCQEQHIEATYGQDIDAMQARLMADYTKNGKLDTKEYFTALGNMMQWPVINKKFNKGFYRHYSKWQGHGIMVTEAKSTKGEKDADVLAEFQYHGAMPKGQGDITYAMHTNILFQTRGPKKWAISTTKDRGHEKVDKMEVEEFAIDYLVDVAGWTVGRRRVG